MPSERTRRGVQRRHADGVGGSPAADRRRRQDLGHGAGNGLRGSAIPLEARIVRVVDAWDAMTNDRPYRAAMSAERALEELRRGSGSAFGLELVELFTRLMAARDAP